MYFVFHTLFLLKKRLTMDASELRFTKGERGNQQLILDGRIFYGNKTYVNKDGSTSYYWYCSAFHSEQKCRMRVTTRDGRVVKTYETHSCVAQPEKYQNQEVRTAIKEAAKTTEDAPFTIVAKALTNRPDSVIASLPSRSVLEKSVSNSRATANKQPQESC